MTKPNPFSPPQAEIQAPANEAVKRASFPWLFVLPRVIGAALLVYGLYGLYQLSQSWAYMADQAIIDPTISPYRFLPSALLRIACGLAVLLRSKWAIPLVIAWIAAFAYSFASVIRWRDLPFEFYFSIMEQLALLAFICLLWVRGRLR